MLRFIIFTTLTVVIISCITPKKNMSGELKNEIFSSELLKEKSIYELNNFLNKDISNLEKTKIQKDLSFIRNIDSSFLERVFERLKFDNNNVNVEDLYLITSFVSAEVYTEYIYILEIKDSKCVGYLYEKSGRIESYNKTNIRKCFDKQKDIDILIRNNQVVNTSIRDNLIILWHYNRNEDVKFKIFYNPSSLELDKLRKIMW